jgi:RHS repeat-associated protein
MSTVVFRLTPIARLASLFWLSVLLGTSTAAANDIFTSRDGFDQTWQIEGDFWQSGDGLDEALAICDTRRACIAAALTLLPAGAETSGQHTAIEMPTGPRASGAAGDTSDSEQASPDNPTGPTDVDSRLISPAIVLPLRQAEARLQLRFEQWYRPGPVAHDIAVEIATWSGDDWSQWRPFAQLTHQGPEASWRKVRFDLAEYSGQQVRLGFRASVQVPDADSTIAAADQATLLDSDAAGADGIWILANVSIVESETPAPASTPMITAMGAMESGAATILDLEDFEGGATDWQIDNGEWEIGTPAEGPSACYSDAQCAGTVLDAYYSPNGDSRLVGPAHDLPGDLGPDERLELRFWEWYAYSSRGTDQGTVEIAVWDGAAWGDWQTLATPAPATYLANTWSRVAVDLSAHAGQRVRLAFRHYARDTGYGGDEYYGWYIDDVALWRGVPDAAATDFEAGQGDWSTDTGLWTLGTPSDGPSACYSGAACFGTQLDGYYPYNSTSRLIRPAQDLPADLGPDERLELRFWAWYAYSASGTDQGTVEIAVWDGAAWSDWQTLATPAPATNLASAWSRVAVDLSAHAGQRVRLAFRHYARDTGYGGDEYYGWYIDDVALWRGVPDAAATDFEAGQGDWSTDTGLWTLGTPSDGPSACYSGAACFGTQLDGYYPYNSTSRLIRPAQDLPADLGPDERLELRFWAWYAYSASGTDQGTVEIAVWDGAAWGDWQTLATPAPATYLANTWSRVAVDLSAHAGQRVRLAFRHYARDTGYGGDEYYGWYIDDVALWRGVPDAAATDFEAGQGDWSTDTGLWTLGTPSDGPSACYSGAACFGTVLDGYYPYNSLSRLIHPAQDLPGDLGPDERLELRFWAWYAYSASGTDQGTVEIAVWDGAAWGDWQTLATPAPATYLANTWSRVAVDLSAHAGQRVRLAFRHYARDTGYGGDEYYGWYIDDVALWRGVPDAAATDFEAGQGDWSTDTGLWTLGTPSDGPSACYSGAACFGTVLDGYYPANSTSRLISPTMRLPAIAADESLLLRFWHWYSYSNSGTDNGQVVLRRWLGDAWGDWEPLGVNASERTQSDGWEPAAVALTEFTTQQVQIAFRHYARDTGYGADEASGWFIDDISLSHFTASTIEIGDSAEGQFSGAADRKYYAVQAPPDGHLRAHLDILDNQGIYQVYLRYGALPTLGQYDHALAIDGADADGLLVPNAARGTWYVLLYADSLGGGSGDYRLQVDFNTGVFITSATPGRVGTAVPATFTLNGAGFAPSSTVTLLDGAGGSAAEAVHFVSAERLEAEIDVTALSPGSYALRVETGEHSDEIEFKLVDGGEAVLETNLVLPSRVGYHALATLWVDYANTGDVAMPAPLLEVSALQNEQPGALLTLDQTRLTSGFWTSAIPEGFANSVQFLAHGASPGILQPGESGRVPVYYAGWQQPWDFRYRPINFYLGVLGADNADVIDWAALEEYMRPPSISAEAWAPVFANLQAQTGTTWGDYVGMLSHNAHYLARLGTDVTDIRDLLAFEVSQARGLSVVSGLTSSVDAQIEASGPSLTFTRSFGVDIASRYTLGRLGRGWSDNWDRSLVVSEDGTVTISGHQGARRVFQPDSRSSAYFAEPGDDGTLADRGGGAFSLTESGGQVSVFRADDKLDFVEDTHGNRITCVWSGDILTRLAHSAGPYLDFTYVGDRIRSVTDSAGRTTTFAYDAGGEHLQSATDDRGQTTVYSYGSGASEHALTRIEHPDGTESEYGYDAAGRLASKTGCAGSPGTTRYTYDAAGTVVTTDPLGHSTETYLDHYGRVARVVDPLGNVTSRIYDRVGNLKEVIDPVGHRRIYSYDGRGNIVSETDELGAMTRYSYGELDRLTQLIDANGNVTRYDYEPDGDLASITYADGSVERWSYDAQGNRVSWTNRRGQTIDYTNDAVGRMTQRDYPDDSQHTFEYDDQGRLTAYTDPLGRTTREYDEDGRLQQITYPGDRWLRYTYHDAGRRASMTDQLGHQTNYHYDEWGRLEALTDESDVEIVRYAYNDAGQLVLKTLGNGVYTTYSYDPAGQLLELANRRPDDGILSRFVYTYDDLGRRSSMSTTYGPGDPRTDLAGTWTYEYDDTGQLVGWTAPDGRQVEYTYDALGNRLNVLDDGARTNYVVNELNQYMQAGNAKYGYDTDGNLSSHDSVAENTDFYWSSDNRLLRLTSPDRDWSYDYDANGNRVRVGNNGTVSEFVIDPAGLGNLVGHYNDTGTLRALYEYGEGLISRLDQTGSRTYYTFDILGNTSEIVDRFADVSATYQFDPFGELLRQSATIEQPFQFVGEYGVMADIELIKYMRAREYSSKWGRFVSPDPLGIYAGDANLYRYVRNQGTLFIDPLGLDCHGGMSDGCSPGWYNLFAPCPVSKCGRKCVECEPQPEPTPKPQPTEPDPPLICKLFPWLCRGEPVPPVRPTDPNEKLGPATSPFKVVIV